MSKKLKFEENTIFPQNLTFNDLEAINNLKFKEKIAPNKVNNLKISDQNEFLLDFNKKLPLESPKFTLEEKIEKSEKGENTLNIQENLAFYKEKINIKPVNFDASLSKYQSILTKLKEENSEKPQLIKKAEPKLKNSLQNSIFSTFSQKNNEKNTEILESFELCNDDNDENEGTFKGDLSMRLNLLDIRKKQLFEQRLNEEISNEFSDSERKNIDEYIHIKDFIHQNKEDNENIANYENMSNSENIANYENNENNENIANYENMSNFENNDKLAIHDIITDRETIEFLQKMKKTYNKGNILLLQNFFQSVLVDMHLMFTSEEELAILLVLQERLTTNNSAMISLNALEIFTKENGFRVSILKLIENVRNTLKLQKSEEINKMALEEINIIKTLLDKKNQELNVRESKLKEFSEILENYYKILENQLEMLFKDHLTQLNKRFITGEKSMKLKVKLLETRVKELKLQGQETSKKIDDKLKSKVEILAKNNEFLKLKIIDLEKKFAIEKENNVNLANKLNKYVAKNATQEKLIKDLQKSTISLEIPSINQTLMTNENNDENNEILENTLKSSKKPLLKKNKNNDENSEILENTLKKPLLKKNNDDSISLLNLLFDILKCLKMTLPVLLQEDSENTMSPNDNHPYGNENFDIGSILYPNFNKIMSHLIDLLPIINKKFEISSIHNYVEILYKMVNFAYRFKSQNNPEYLPKEVKNSISSKKLESSSLKIKSLQDHVNEIMFSSKNTNFELIFTPQSEFWKKFMKKTSNKPLFDKKKPLLKACFPLFPSEILQNEIISIMKKYLNDSNFCVIPKNTFQNDKKQNFYEIPLKNSLEVQKFILMIRIKLSLLILLFSTNFSEIDEILQFLLQNINNENEAMNDYMKKNMLDNDAINVLFSIIKIFHSNLQSVTFIIDILLNMSSNGEHYKGFIMEISEDRNFEVLLKLFMEFIENNELCEKLAVIIQKITYHNNIKGKIEGNYINMFKEKHEKMEKIENSEFFVINLKSILNNIE